MIGGLARHRVEPARLNVTEQDALSSYTTPPALVERVRSVLGEIELDPATTVDNPVGATRFYTPADDGILQPWNGARVFLNPPFGRTIRLWVEKAMREAAAGSPVVLLAPVRADSAWFHEAAKNARAILFFRGRLSYGIGGTHNAAPFASCLMGFGVDLAPLSDLGLLLPGGAS